MEKEDIKTTETIKESKDSQQEVSDKFITNSLEGLVIE